VVALKTPCPASNAWRDGIGKFELIELGEQFARILISWIVGFEGAMDRTAAAFGSGLSPRIGWHTPVSELRTQVLGRCDGDSGV
jgi:hypothetical protein